MKILSALALSAVMAFSPLLNSAEPTPIPFAVSYQDLQASAVTVRASEGSGSGVIVLKPNGDIFCWTAAHVIGESKADVTLIKQVVVNGRAVGLFSVEAEVISISKTQDLAVLKPRSAYFFKTGAKFESALFVPKLGDPAVHVGSLHGLPGAESVTTGIVSFAGRVMEGLIFDQTTATAMPGSSGGGVWSAEGKLIGLVVSGYSDTFSFIVPVRRMHEWAIAEKHPEWIGLDKVP